MTIKNVIFIICIFLMSILITKFVIMTKPVQKIPLKIEMKLVDGTWVTETHQIPIDAKLSIGEHRGSYYLEYSDGYSSERIKNAVIDYRIIKE